MEDYLVEIKNKIDIEKAVSLIKKIVLLSEFEILLFSIF